MSLESNIQALTGAIVALTEALNRAGVQQAPVPLGPSAIAAQAPAVVAPAAPVFAPQPAATQAVTTPAATMPPPPFPGVAAAPAFTAPAAAPAAPEPIPFADVQGACAWLVEQYKAAPHKGNAIQAVLGAMGLPAISAIQPHQFEDLVNRMRAIP